MKRLLILSGKGGTGKTTVAGAFIKLKKAKAFADCDVDAPNLHLIMEQKAEAIKKDYFGMGKARIDTLKCTACGECESNCRFDAITSVGSVFLVNDFSCEGCGVCEAVCPTKAIHLNPAVAGELRLFNDDAVFSTAQLKMGRGTSGKIVTEVKKQLNIAKEKTDIAIIDGSPGIGCPVIASLSGVDMVLIVAEPSLSGISDMQRIIETAQKFNVKIAVCVNKFDTNIENTIKIEQLCAQQHLSFVGRIPFDFQIVTALNKGQSIIDFECEGSKAIIEVYEKTMVLMNMNR